MPNLRRWFSSTRASDARNLEDQRRVADEQEGFFCESLLGLMERTGRFEYVDFTKDHERKSSSTGEEETRGKDKESRTKRFSWSR